MPHAQILFFLLFLITALQACTNINSELLKAAQTGPTATIEALLDKGADINTKDDDSLTPLIWAAEYGHIDIVQKLLNRGADIKIKGPD